MRKNKKSNSRLESSSSGSGRNRDTQSSQRMQSGRGRDFDTDSEMGGNEEYFRNEGRSHQSPRSDYDFEQMDRGYYGMSQGGRYSNPANSPMDVTGRYGQDAETRNSRDFTGNFPSAEMSGLNRQGAGNRWSQSSQDNMQDGGSGYRQQGSFNQGASQGSYGAGSFGQGLHSGKGPKGYQRSDERIREEVCDALEAHSHIDASEIEVEVSEGIVTLTGTVEARQTKRLVEEAAEHVRGVKDVYNQLQISAKAQVETQSSGFQASGRNQKNNKKSSANYKQ